MSVEHRRPLYAFVALVVICGVVLGQAYRSQALSQWLAPGWKPAAVVAGVIFAPASAESAEPVSAHSSDTALQDVAPGTRRGTDLSTPQPATAATVTHPAPSMGFSSDAQAEPSAGQGVPQTQHHELPGLPEVPTGVVPGVGQGHPEDHANSHANDHANGHSAGRGHRLPGPVGHLGLPGGVRGSEQRDHAPGRSGEHRGGVHRAAGAVSSLLGRP